ncbi:hypothetical protein FGL86_07340 [Pistricoccus aurantiacus]|uniref:DUF4136 domain-containing protein n=1 Tax=Pistricoccus aurantiacus TaxID=1883414 RepID=A0A5B8STY1_9GAMM|nr:hypothetical protein [Pistricoccus aurantiacus]QEA38905.1 hypothetical protein FGL86_07340 [Pistricoccus aurantiacus]
MRRMWFLCLLGLSLIGCVTDSSSLPRNGAPLAPACTWPITEEDTLAYSRRAIVALEAQEFRIIDTDLSLGLINAQRQRVLVGYSSAGRNGWGGGGVFGWAGSGGGGVGIGLGSGAGFGGYAADPLREERLTLLIDNDTARLSRNIRIIEADGWVRTSHAGASEDFCRELRQTIEASPVREVRP